ncbi:MAG: response regulator transcription factor [Campylobacteraceae bacterium]|jgi:two-component system OmpR family response regulator|nr:response regulator transcription factor [Campylobacteraceae bacterium]
MENLSIIMIEDDEELAYLLSNFLKQYNLDVTNYADPFLGISALNIHKYDLLILDLSLPGLDGLDICKEVRERSDIPIIISSARSDVEDKIIGLDLGADDYLPKPYEPKELYARIMSIIRRYKTSYKTTEKESSFILNEDARTIVFKGEILKLTQAEYEVLSTLIERVGCVVSRRDLIRLAPSLGDENESRSLDVLISRIRSKLNDNSKNPQFLHSIRGIGYRLNT